jgi:PAS domain S-box-containing protein
MGGNKPTYEELEKRIKELSKSGCELKLSIKKFNQSEERFRNLIEGSIQGVLIHRGHIPLFVNKKWANIHGYSPEEILMMNTVVQLISPKDQKRMIKYKEARHQGKDAPTDYEYQGVHKDGSFIWLENRVQSCPMGEPRSYSNNHF